MSYEDYVARNFERLSGVAPQGNDIARIASVLDSVLTDLRGCQLDADSMFDLDPFGFERYLETLRTDGENDRD